ncbi:MAG TPA: hypothetical protein VFU03_06405, partial [Gemmatimonadales bacterium]|nr:hypothetical protein [Gemmatimonadales bacterium]
EEIARGYRAFCAATHRTNCLEGPLTDSSVYQIAFDFALGSQRDGFAGEVKSTIDPSTIRLVLLTGLVIFMATIALPELVSKIPAAAATMVLTAYLGAQAVCDLVFGWSQMVRELDAATTFDEVRAAGQRYGRLVGAQTARILILLATAAIAQGGLIARLMKLPRATQASAALATETGGVGLEAVSAVKEVRVLQGGVAITVVGAAKGAVGVAMASHGAPQQSGQPPPGPTAQEPQRGPHATGDKAAGTLPAKAPKGVSDVPGSKPPFRGEPGSTSRGQTQSRTYGEDGFPKTDRDLDHPDESGIGRGDHCHDWGRPPGGGPPKAADRGTSRLPAPNDPPPPRGTGVPPENP